MTSRREDEYAVGWSVVRNAPWHFVGFFATEDEARAKATEMGAGYIARYGERQENTFSFYAREGGRTNMMTGSIFAPATEDKWLE